MLYIIFALYLLLVGIGLSSFVMASRADRQDQRYEDALICGTADAIENDLPVL